MEYSTVAYRPLPHPTLIASNNFIPPTSTTNQLSQRVEWSTMTSHGFQITDLLAIDRVRHFLLAFDPCLTGFTEESNVNCDPKMIYTLCTRQKRL